MAMRRSRSWITLALCESAIAAIGIVILLVLDGTLDAEVLKTAAETSKF